MKKRIISAAVLIAITVACVFASRISRVLLFAVAAGLCIYEYSSALSSKKVYCSLWVMYVCIAIQAVLAIIGTDLGVYLAVYIGAVYVTLTVGIINAKASGQGAEFTLAALAYPCMPFSMLMYISVSNIWAQTLAIACLSSWSCDCFALLGGKRFGKHKLAPNVSPNKTVEGSICGAVMSLLGGAVAYFILLRYRTVPHYVCLITALISSTLGQIGDLAESLIKRMLDIKDFSDLIPGHGGMFDRADSLLFAIPAAYLCLRIAEML